MSAATFLIERAGHAFTQDLGRPGHGSIGVPVNGALDQGAARTANLLVGNDEGDTLVEVTGSELMLVPDADLLLSVTGAAEHVLVDGHRQPSWEALAIARGSRVAVPVPVRGYRSYVAINGAIDSPRALGSVAPDPLLGVGTRLEAGDRVVVHRRYDAHAGGHLGRLFRLGAVRPRIGEVLAVQVTQGPDLDRMTLGRDSLAGTFHLLAQSDHVGLRLDGARVEQTTTAEILSRGVPVGAVEVPPTGGIIVLLRGRLVTAGYPVVAVVTTASLDVLAQAAPGAAVRMDFCDLSAARTLLRRRAAERSALADRVRTAFAAKGLSHALTPPSPRPGGTS